MRVDLLKTPTGELLALWAAMLAVGAATVWLALIPPWLGVRLSVAESGEAVRVDAAPAHAEIPPGAFASSLRGRTGEPIALLPADLVEEPDFYDTYEEMDAFFARQGALDAILRSGTVHLSWRAPGGASGEATLKPGKRPIGSLPFVFWFQLGVGLACPLIAGWVYFLRPREWGTRLFALTGLAFPLSALSAAIYSTRELALPEGLFRVLSMLNHFGATAFGMALVGLFLVYPRPLVRPAGLLWIPAVFVPWFLADVFRWLPDLNWSVRLPLIVELVLAAVFAVMQWRASRRDPLARAALRWFALSTLVGCSLFILAVPAHSTLGLLPPLPQGYAFGFFLIMYGGIALGLRRHRLFDIDEWAYRILLWVAGATTVLALDVLLILLGVGQTLSLGLAVLIAGWLYFPFRQWLWERLVRRTEPRLETLLPELADFAFMGAAEAREAQWDALLRRVFDPLEIHREDSAHTQARVFEDGLALGLPGANGISGRLLRFADAGTRLFSSRDVTFADALAHLVQEILAHRESFDRGVREERQRLARDLHDNLGARLLRLIHHLRGSPDADIAREAMRDLRAAIAAIDASPAPVAEAAADWHAEIEARCATAGVQLAWEQGDLPTATLLPRKRAALGSALREAVTNALKHADASRLAVTIRVRDASLEIAVANDGPVTDPDRWSVGYGLRSIRARLHDLGGMLEITPGDIGVCLRMRVPLERLQP